MRIPSPVTTYQKIMPPAGALQLGSSAAVAFIGEHENNMNAPWNRPVTARSVASLGMGVTTAGICTLLSLPYHLATGRISSKYVIGSL